MMVSKHDDKVDFDKLERELDDALEHEQQYWKENDAKFRAVDQRVANYEEFREIVLAANLKPLDKEDKMGTTRFKQSWNVIASGSSAAGETKISDDISQDTVKLPSNGHEFALSWRRFNKDGVDKYTYLLGIGAQRLGELFKSEISFGLLGEILLVLQQHTCAEDIENITDILTSLSNAGRFSLSVKFLSAAEKETCAKLFSQVFEVLHGRQPETVENEHVKVFNSLKNVYEI